MEFAILLADLCGFKWGSVGSTIY